MKPGAFKLPPKRQQINSSQTECSGNISRAFHHGYWTLNYLRRTINTGLTGNGFVFYVSAFLILVGNVTFFEEILKVYPLSTSTAFALATLPFMLGLTSLLLLGVLSFGRTTKPVLAVILVLSSLAAYFMDSYGVVISSEMLQNATQTNFTEASDLLNLKLIAYLGVLGILPAVAIFRVPFRWRGWRTELLARLKFLALAIVLLGVIIVSFGSFYASFFREHKVLRFYANPTYYVYSAIKLLGNPLEAQTDSEIVRIGTDAQVETGDPQRELIFLVIGETARADRFSLNGYPRDTNPMLRQENVVSFTNFWSCGTSTAVSVPCMFSALGKGSYTEKQANHQENLLDVVKRSGAHIVWLDNNSDSKGVAVRVPYESYRTPEKNPVCDVECRDEGMLAHLQKTIDAHPSGDIVIVMHQMGNHGPAYYKRYPKSFERFAPVCKSNDLSRCKQEEIDNAYDNAILYTDYFLSKAISILKRNDDKFETALFYISDHGESLGESGLFLHGLPYAIAPNAQTHVPAIMWFGKRFDEVDVTALANKRGLRFSHDNLFHTVLGELEIQSDVYRPELDILRSVHKAEKH